MLFPCKGFEKVNQIVDFNYSEDEWTITTLIKKTIQTSVQISEQCAIIPMKLIGLAAEESQKLLERKLKDDYKIDLNSWMFSSENIETIEKISRLISVSAKEITHLGIIKITRFMIAYSILQRLTRATDPQLIFGKDFESFRSSKLLLEKAERYCRVIFFRNIYHIPMNAALINYLECENLSLLSLFIIKAQLRGSHQSLRKLATRSFKRN